MILNFTLYGSESPSQVFFILLTSSTDCLWNCVSRQTQIHLQAYRDFSSNILLASLFKTRGEEPLYHLQKAGRRVPFSTSVSPRPVPCACARGH